MAHLSNPPAGWCRIDEAAEIIGCSPKTIYRRVIDGTLQQFGPVRKEAGVWLISRIAVYAASQAPDSRLRRWRPVRKWRPVRWQQIDDEDSDGGDDSDDDSACLLDDRPDPPVTVQEWFRLNRAAWADEHSKVLSIHEERQGGAVIRVTRRLIDAAYI